MLDLTTKESRIALATKYAAKHGLDPAIVAAVCEQESGWSPWAVRFEVGFLHNYVKPANPVSPTTMELMKATSFGLMQVMGLVAMELGWRGYFLTELCDPDIGVDYGCRKLQKCFATHGDPEPSLRAYNGGGNASYASQVLARVSKYEAGGSEGAD
jgi:soluble lytic murein transglycosylase-like protein